MDAARLHPDVAVRLFAATVAAACADTTVAGSRNRHARALTAVLCHLLTFKKQHDTVALSQLVPYCGLDTSTLAKSLHHLHARGLIDYRPGSTVPGRHAVSGQLALPDRPWPQHSPPVRCDMAAVTHTLVLTRLLVQAIVEADPKTKKTSAYWLLLLSFATHMLAAGSSRVEATSTSLGLLAGQVEPRLDGASPEDRKRHAERAKKQRRNVTRRLEELLADHGQVTTPVQAGRGAPTTVAISPTLVAQAAAVLGSPAPPAMTDPQMTLVDVPSVRAEPRSAPTRRLTPVKGDARQPPLLMAGVPTPDNSGSEPSPAAGVLQPVGPSRSDRDARLLAGHVIDWWQARSKHVAIRLKVELDSLQSPLLRAVITAQQAGVPDGALRRRLTLELPDTGDPAAAALAECRRLQREHAAIKPASPQAVSRRAASGS